MEDYWKFHDWIVRTGRCTKFVNFKIKSQPKMAFSEGRRGTKSLHKGGERSIIHIFWNNLLKDSIISIVPVWNMRRNSISKGLKYGEVFCEDSGNKDNIILSLLFKLGFTQKIVNILKVSNVCHNWL